MRYKTKVKVYYLTTYGTIFHEACVQNDDKIMYLEKYKSQVAWSIFLKIFYKNGLHCRTNQLEVKRVISYVLCFEHFKMKFIVLCFIFIAFELTFAEKEEQDYTFVTDYNININVKWNKLLDQLIEMREDGRDWQNNCEFDYVFQF